MKLSSIPVCTILAVTALQPVLLLLLLVQNYLFLNLLYESEIINTKIHL